MARSYSEIMGLQMEAERLVRMGESRADVSRRLGVSVQTLAGWALAGGWRKKDLDMERSGEATRATIRAIGEGNAQDRMRRQVQGELADVMRQAVVLLADGSAASLARVQAMLGEIREAPRLVAPRVEMGPDPAIIGVGSLGDGDMDNVEIEPDPDDPNRPLTDEELLI